MNIACKFCQKDAEYLPLNLRTKSGHSRLIHVNYCFTCNAEWAYWADNMISVAEHLYTNINSKKYRWSLYNNVGRLYYIEWPGIPGIQANSGVKLLKSFNEYSGITPQNIETKIKFMLTYL